MDAVSVIRRAEPTPTPWRFRLNDTQWRILVQALMQDPLPFVGMWCDGQDVHAVFLETGSPLAATLALEGGRFLALSPARDVASLYERIICDLYGAEVLWAVDDRPLLDHNVWQASMPMGRCFQFGEEQKGLLRFHVSDDFSQSFSYRRNDVLEGWGPATGSMDSPFHVSAVLRKGHILRAESQIGYAHRGLALRWRHSSIKEACRLSARVCAGVSMAHQVAFCMAVEKACGVEVTWEVSLLRVTLLELERVVHHLYKLASLARLIGAGLVANRCMSLREDILEAQVSVTGSRFLMDVCFPGTVILRKTDYIGELCHKLYRYIDEKIISLATIWRDYPGLGTRLAVLGAIPCEAVVALGVEGPVARASGKEYDHRRIMPSYAELWRYTGIQRQGTGEDRAFLLFDEITESVRMLGKLANPLSTVSVIEERVCHVEKGEEGIAMVEGPWGPVFYWVWLSQGYISHVFQRGPEYALQCLFERVLHGHTMEDLPLLACSLGVNTAALDS